MKGTTLGVALLTTSLAVSSIAGAPAKSESSAESAADLEAQIRSELDAASFESAERLARRHLARIAETEGRSSMDHAVALELLVEALLGGGKALDQETALLAQGAIDLKQNLLSHDDPELATSLLLLGRLHYDRGEPAAAIAVLERALDIRQAKDPDDVFLISILRSLANALLAVGDLARAEAAYQREGRLISIHRGEISMDAAGHAYNTARFLIEVGEWREAERLYGKAAEIVKELHGTSNSRLAYPLLGIANARSMLGETTSALEVLEQTLDLTRETMRPDHPFVASCYESLGFVHREMGDFEAARQAFAEALDRADRTYGPNHEATGRALWLLANVERMMGELDPAEEHLTRALAIFDGPSITAPGLDARAEYAMLLADRGQLDRALAELEVVRAETPATAPRHHLLGLHVFLGDLLLRAGRADDAYSTLNAAAEEFTGQVGEDFPVYIELLAALARASAQSGRTVEAAEVAVRSERLGAERIGVMIAGLSERQALAFAESRATTRDLLLELAARGEPNTVKAAWNAVIESRGIVLDEIAQRRRAMAELGDSQSAEELVVASRRLANLLVRGPAGDLDAYTAALAEARNRRDAAERNVARRSRSFRELQAEKAVSLDEIRGALPPGSALAAYVAWENDDHGRQYGTFVLGGGYVPRLVRLGSADEIEASVDDYRSSMMQGVLDDDVANEIAFRETTIRLRELIWDPISTLVGEAKRVFIVPEGDVHLVSFATLPLDSGGYLIDAGLSFQYQSAERDIARKPSAHRGHGLLVLGDPDYDAGNSSSDSTSESGEALRGDSMPCPAFENIRFGRLPESGREARRLGKRWSKSHEDPREADVRLLTGKAATESRFIDAAPGRLVIHLATHGFFIDGSCEDRPSEVRGIGGLAKSTGNPVSRPTGALALSGLALAGANRRSTATTDEHDGILLAQEIAAQDLAGIEWAVLSACDTGLGRIRPNEGIFGLRRAFSVAGVRTLIMTLWPTRDNVTTEWMGHLYEARLERNQDTTAAVTEAMLSVLEDRRKRGVSTHPAIWGAFVASGDWR